MKDFLNRILSDSYNFNKLDRVLELKLVDIQEKYESGEKVEDLLNFREELSSVRELLLSEDLCKIYKSCKITSFLLSYSFLHHRTLINQPSSSNVPSDDSHRGSKEERHNSSREDRSCRTSDEWNKFIGELTSTALDSTSLHIDNTLVNSHLVALLHDLALYLTHKQFNRTHKTLVTSLYGGVIKFSNSLSSGGKLGELNHKLNEVILTILSYYHSTNQLQNEHINQIDKICNISSNTSFNRESTLSDSTYTGERNWLRGAYDLMLKVNKNYLSSRVNNLESVDVSFLTYTLSVIASSGSSTSSGDLTDLNLFNIYQLIINLIRGMEHNTSIDTAGGTSTTLETPYKAVQLFDLLNSVVRLLNKDLVLLHLNKVVEIVNLLFQYVIIPIFTFRSRFILETYSGRLLEVLKCLNGHCVNFSSLINFQLLADLVETDTGNAAPEDTNDLHKIPVDSLRLYAYLIDNSRLESLVDRLMYDDRMNSVLFDQYLSNILTQSADYDHYLLLRVYCVVKKTGNNRLMGQLKFLLSH
ncbi:hypothetical protein MACJ_004085 [Theileria orientalis]|uniref:Uncharacterized protein n=1 Tax=Theileria orientalis TaxID=68886 RepID=A0A976SKW0_THEOR|nr:hypothetical protein MACJ_004085 [Theileria orientalis]